MSSILAVLHASQAAFSAYNLYLCAISITNLMGYQEKSEKAAQYSQTAADQLHKTRTTQASAAISVRITRFSLPPPSSLYFSPNPLTLRKGRHLIYIIHSLSTLPLLNIPHQACHLWQQCHCPGEREEICREFVEGQSKDSLAGGGGL